MKFLTSQMMAALKQPQMRQNLRALLRYVAVLTIFIVLYSVLFHVLMVYEGQEHSWLTGLYWTLTVMSTLGFGDITFHSDLGRAFSVLVLMTGIVLLLIVLPFAFIRYLYAPWLEAQIRITAPRELLEGTVGHVVIAKMDALAEALARRLHLIGTPYVVLEEDPARAVALVTDGIRVVTGDPESSEAWVAVRARTAKLIVANIDDAHNTNVTLTVREHAPDVPVLAFAEDKDAVDILHLAGATHVVPIKHRLGAQLAARVSAGRPGAHVIGGFRDLLIAELPVHETDLAGKTIRETRLRELTGMSVVGFWERGHLMAARPDAVLGEHSIAVLAGTREQVEGLDAMFSIYEPNENPVLVIGGGKVGRAVIRALKERGIKVHVVEENPTLEPVLQKLADLVIIGDAAEIEVMRAARIGDVPSVVITTHDDATNIYLAIYCRRLNPDCRIVSRIMLDRNLEAMHRAGADFVLGETALAVRSVLAALQNRELLVVGEEVDLFVVPVPAVLGGKTLAESGIGATTGLNVIGLQNGEDVVSSPTATSVLTPGAQLLLLGTNDQRAELGRVFGV